MRSIIASIVLLLSSATVSATTIHVPADQPTIQAGIDAAVSGDTVLVTAGTYQETLDLLGKSIALIGEYGLDRTVLMGVGTTAALIAAVDNEPGVVIKGLTFTGSMRGSASAIGVSNAEVSVDSCFFHYLDGPNGAQFAVCVVSTGSATIRRNVFSNNSLWGVIYVDTSSTAQVVNNTVTGNTDAGLSVYGDSSLVANNIVTGCGYYGFYQADNSTITYAYNNIWDNGTDYLNGISPGLGDISVDPMFVDQTGDDVRLLRESPCIDTGDPDPIYNDPDGSRNDMGALPARYYGPIWRVATEGNDTTGDGSQAAPFGTIQHAIDVSIDGDTILVMSGTYSGPGNRDLDPSGKALVILSERGTDSTVINCDGDSVENHRGFYIHSNEDSNTVIIGLTIRGGYSDSRGGGVHIVNASPWFRDCRFVDNSTGHNASYSGGGGVHCLTASPRFSSCVFDSNTTDHDGGGLFVCLSSHPTLDSCAFWNNSAEAGGAVSMYQNCQSQFRHAEFAENTAEVGGAVQTTYESDTSSLWLSCVFRNNSAVTYGGAMSCVGSSPELFQCTMAGNSSAMGSAIACINTSSPTIQESIIAFNLVGEPIECNVSDPASSPALTCSNVFGNEEGDWIGCIQDQLSLRDNLRAAPRFCDTAVGDYGLAANSQCAPGNSECGYRIGAVGVACDSISVVWHVTETGSDSTGDGSEAAPFATIQHAVDASINGDTVLVHDGTYTGEGNQEILLGTRRLVILSENGSSATILDVEDQSARGYVIEEEQDTLTVIQGFTIRNAPVGVYLFSSPLLIDLVLEDNDEGIICNGNPFVRGVVFSFNNIGVDAYGGTIACVQCSFEGNDVGVMMDDGGYMTLDSCTLLNNAKGIELLDGVVACKFCSFNDNTCGTFAISSGGSVAVDSSDFSGNGTAAHGNCDLSNSLISDGARGVVKSTREAASAVGCTFENLDMALEGTGGKKTLDPPRAVWGFDLSDCEITGCDTVAYIVGGDVYEPDRLVLSDCWIHDNGGITTGECHVAMTNTRYENNTSGVNIGYNAFQTVLIQDCAILGNGADALSVSCCDGEVVIRRTVIADNQGNAFSFDGGCHESLDIEDATIVGNAGHGISIADFYELQMTITRSLIAYNAGYGVLCDTLSSDILVSCCDVFDNVGGNYNLMPDQVGTNGNISLDPLFCDTAAGDYHISSCSPCAPDRNECGVLIGALDTACTSYCGPVWHVAVAGDDLEGDGSDVAPFATIQYAVDMAIDGDTVLIQDGTYIGVGNRDIVVYDMSLAVVSESGPESTIIDCQGDSLNPHRGFDIRGDSTNTVSLRGLTIVNGWGSEAEGIESNSGAGGGLLCVTCTMAISNCVFQDNEAGHGAAVYLESAYSTVDSCEFEENTGWVLFSGYDGETTITGTGFIANNGIGLFGLGATDIIAHECRFENNEQSGVELDYCDSVLFTSCSFSSNSSEGVELSGGIGPVHFLGCAFEGNSGAGLRAHYQDGECSLSSCVFRGNALGAAFVQEGEELGVTFDGCHFWANSGSALDIWSDPADLSFTNCTFVRNQSNTNSVIHHWFNEPSTLSLENCLIAFNRGGDPVEFGDPEDSPTGLSLACCDVFGNEAGDYVGQIADYAGANGNISLDPLFCDRAAGGYSLYNTSPCAADNNSCGVLIGAFDVGCSAPVVEVITVDTVGDNQHVLSDDPLIFWSWTDSLGLPQAEFEIAVGTDDDWTYAEMWNPAPFVSSDTFVVYGGSDLVDGVTYWARLRVSNDAAWSEWYEISFRMNSVPSVPTPSSPAGWAVTDGMVTLWLQNALDAELDTLTYDFIAYHDTDCVFGPPIDVQDYPETPDSTGLLVDLTTAENCFYCWRARAFDGYEYGEWSDYECFNISGTPEAPATPVLISPVDQSNGILYDMRPEFFWSWCPDPDPGDTVLYKVELAIDSNFSFVMTVDSLAENRYTPDDSLEFHEQYWWRVTAHDQTSLESVSSVAGWWTWTLGDMDYDHMSSMGDLTLMIDHLFISLTPLDPMITGDLDGDCTVTMGDLTILIDHLFISLNPLTTPGCEAPKATTQSGGKQERERPQSRH